MLAEKLLPTLQTEEELELTVKGRRSGRDLPRPVWFALRDKELLLLPVKGSLSQWYKNILKNPLVKIDVAGQSYTGNVEPVREKRNVSEVVELFRKKYGAGDIKKYYPRLDVAVRLSLA